MNNFKLPAVLSLDLMFTWYSEIAKTECQRRLRIYQKTSNIAIVIVSELTDNPDNTIITNEELRLIHLICDKYSLNPSKTMWLEHYPKRYPKEEETYKQVILLEDNVWSKRIKKEQIETLLGVKLE